MEYSAKVKMILTKKIHEVDAIRHQFVHNPKCDFTRKRKLDFEKMIWILLTMEGASMKKELLEYFQFDINTPTVSAFNQQRAKLLPEALSFLFDEFNKSFSEFKTYHGYRLIACDGSNLNIAKNPDDHSTYFHSTPNDRGYNRLHLNVLYDLCGKRYINGFIEPARKMNESQACIDMLKNTNSGTNMILIADRNYESFNIFEHAQLAGWKYVIRIKDRNSNGIASGLKLPKQEIFDIDYCLLITRSLRKEFKTYPKTYKFISKNQNFDYLPVGDKGVYPMNFRIVRFPISDGNYEMIVTNIKQNEFSIDKIKEIYHMRWGVETSFRELKYAIGLTNFHAKKVEYIKQEIYARLILYNYCEIIAINTVTKPRDTKHTYQLNNTMAIHICRYFLKCRNDIPPPDVETLIKKNILPLRNGRSDPRKVKSKKAISFLYRIT